MDTKEMRMVCLSLILIKKCGKRDVVVLATLRAGMSVKEDERIKPDFTPFDVLMSLSCILTMQPKWKPNAGD